MKNVQLLSTLLAGAMIGTLAGCGTAQSAQTSESVSTVETQQPAAEAQQPAEDAVLTIASTAAPATFDRYNSDHTNDLVTLGMLWGDSLVDSDHAGNYSPWLATEWFYNEDGTEVTFNLRTDAIFTDGSALTSEDVKATLERFITQEDILYRDKYAKYITSIDTPDDATVVLHLSSPMPALLSELSMTPIIPAEAAEDFDTFWVSPYGSGPYALADFDTETYEMTFEKNESWWGWAEGYSSNVAQIHYLNLETQDRIDDLLDGSVQIANELDGAADTFANTDVEFVVYAKAKHQFLVENFNDASYVLNDEKIREALSLCLDRDAMSAAIGDAGSAMAPTIPGSVGYSSDIDYTYDPERAAQLVQESGYDGTPIYMECSEKGGEAAFAFVQEAAAQVGLTVELYDEAASDHWDLKYAIMTISNGENMTEIGSITRDERESGYQNPELTSLGEKAAVTFEADAAQQVRHDFYQVILNNYAPYIFTTMRAGTYAYNKNVSGFVMFNDTFADYRFVTVD